MTEESGRKVGLIYIYLIDTVYVGMTGRENTAVLLAMKINKINTISREGRPDGGNTPHKLIIINNNSNNNNHNNK